MREQNFIDAMHQIELSKDAQARIIEQLKKSTYEKEGNAMNKKSFHISFAVAAVLVVCIITVCATPFASTIGGYFKDIVSWNGAITGSVYENATNEIEVKALDLVVEENSIHMPMEITFKHKDLAPYKYLEEISVKDIEFIDGSGKSKKVSTDAKAIVEDGKAVITIEAKPQDLSANKIVIKSFYGLKKADAPLEIKGQWECALETK